MRYNASWIDDILRRSTAGPAARRACRAVLGVFLRVQPVLRRLTGRKTAIFGLFAADGLSDEKGKKFFLTTVRRAAAGRCGCRASPSGERGAASNFSLFLARLRRKEQALPRCPPAAPFLSLHYVTCFTFHEKNEHTRHVMYSSLPPDACRRPPAGRRPLVRRPGMIIC